MDMSPRSYKRRIASMFCLMLIAVPASALDISDAASSKSILHERPAVPVEERVNLESILTNIAQSHVATEERLPGQQPLVIAKVWFNEEGDALNVELGKAYLPTYYTITFEERLLAIGDALINYMERVTPIYQVDIWFEGRDIFEYFPEERGPPERAAREPGQTRRPKRDLGNGRVLVSAGHGVYYNDRFKDWRPQRDPENAITEDYATPAFARRLDQFLLERGGTEVFRARSTSRERHPESGVRWYSMAARYHIKDAVPELPSIWNSPGHSEPGLEERDQDIRSRPLFANHLGVDAALHVHTNADGNPATRGLRVYYHPKNRDGERLAEMARCYMKESLGSNEFYASYPVSPFTHPKNHGETRLADMPSVIVEVGFHTNKEDANAIQSDVFQTLSMRGLEKAYRLFRQGHSCDTFTASYSDVSVVSDSSSDASIELSGFPRFPVKYTSIVTECPSGVICGAVSGRFQDSLSPLKITHNCSTDKAFTIKWRVRFTDADGIQAETPASMQCNPKAKIARSS